jgi:hypothetical protein
MTTVNIPVSLKIVVYIVTMFAIRTIPVSPMPVKCRGGFVVMVIVLLV